MKLKNFLRVLQIVVLVLALIIGGGFAYLSEINGFYHAICPPGSIWEGTIFVSSVGG